MWKSLSIGRTYFVGLIWQSQPLQKIHMRMQNALWRSNMSDLILVVSFLHLFVVWYCLTMIRNKDVLFHPLVGSLSCFNKKRRLHVSLAQKLVNMVLKYINIINRITSVSFHLIKNIFYVLNLSSYANISITDRSSFQCSNFKQRQTP